MKASLLLDLPAFQPYKCHMLNSWMLRREENKRKWRTDKNKSKPPAGFSKRIQELGCSSFRGPRFWNMLSTLLLITRPQKMAQVGGPRGQIISTNPFLHELFSKMINGSHLALGTRTAQRLRERERRFTTSSPQVY